MDQEPLRNQDYFDYYDQEAQAYRQRKKDKKKKNQGTIALALICSLVGGLVGAAVMNALGPITMASQSDSGQKIQIQASDDASIGQAVAAKAMDSVVGITTESVKNTFFGPMAVKGSGSGFIVDKKGYIVTNAHVVANRTKNTVTTLFNDGSQDQAQVLWEDPSLDLAILKVNGKKDLSPVDLGDSDKTAIGEPAIAIGNPLGLDLQRSVTKGIISGLNRSVGSGQGNYIDGLIQTDASINEGNSGGPLFNSKGQVIGINTAKISSAEGLGFSIPINTLKPILDQVIQTGSFKTVSLGVVVANPQTVEAHYRVNLGVKEGAFVMDVYPGGAASKAGLKQGDIITQLGDKEIKDTNSLKKLMYSYKVGDKVKIKYIRDKKNYEGEVTFQESLKAQEKPKAQVQDQAPVQGQDPFSSQGQFPDFGGSFFGQ